ncbi:hypothetical protein [Bifidobacterium miconis]|nr:hypothetical protein [Bifidobacterium miconis]
MDDMDRQRLITIVEQFDRELEQERETIETLKGVKKAHLGLMFPG